MNICIYIDRWFSLETHHGEEGIVAEMQQSRLGGASSRAYNAWWIIKQNIQEGKLVHSLWGLLPLTMSTRLAPCPDTTTASQSSTNSSNNLGSTLQIHEHEGDISISHLKTLSFCARALARQAEVGKSPLWGLFNFCVCSHGPHGS